MSKKIVSVALAGLVVGLVVLGLFVPAHVAQAAAQATPLPWRATLAPLRETLAALPTQDPVYLENLLQREQLALNNQATRLSLAGQTAAATQDYIDAQQAAGKDTAALETALAAFNQAIDEATASNAGAAGILASPAGFDAAGKVTDRQLAGQTVRDAGRALRSAHLTLTSATLDLRTAVQQFRTGSAA
jgi:hypothetical protein